MKKKYCVLFYNRMWEQNFVFNEHDVPDEFFLTDDHSYVEVADAIVFHMPSLRVKTEFEKRKNQLWVFWSMECELNYPFFYRKEILQWFDIFMTYTSDSDVQVPYLLYEHIDKLRGFPLEKTHFVNAFISSSFNQSKRQEYLKSLMSSIKIDSYGKFINNKKIVNDN